MEAPGCADPGAVAGGPSLPTSNGAGQLYRAGAPLDGRGCWTPSRRAWRCPLELLSVWHEHGGSCSGWATFRLDCLAAPPSARTSVSSAPSTADRRRRLLCAGVGKSDMGGIERDEKAPRLGSRTVVVQQLQTKDRCTCC